MQESIDKIDTSLAKLEEGASRSKVLRNQANFIANKLELFDRTYLNSSAAASDQDSNWYVRIETIHHYTPSQIWVLH